ncbi:hypothetical protein FUT69_07080 [Xylella taiwanensis]|uniref:Uncharacterized protein n=2 Tax=Xylella taiwanensis TaxID=1444770 RepID=A0ABS8TUZ6_9GAMM|nr:hypothetical protein [Xylella taiwanensis]MCD8455545.1 hypothetical protein [Xylella taiwanensis]MCD8460087.1 hypothetical protein [Xylella taiwanensis]MCD8464591.1 hypothetical protein [Xylella taiwanensis]MCD8467850.1 hypothetical protein [Xylella taiwanensis]MCD8472876.1 hypothetical protein [Xylella taiwanensis]
MTMFWEVGMRALKTQHIAVSHAGARQAGSAPSGNRECIPAEQGVATQEWYGSGCRRLISASRQIREASSQYAPDIAPRSSKVSNAA